MPTPAHKRLIAYHLGKSGLVRTIVQMRVSEDGTTEETHDVEIILPLTVEEYAQVMKTAKFNEMKWIRGGNIQVLLEVLGAEEIVAEISNDEREALS